ncbi:MAG: hypothetical protein AVDCRST_MAG13-930, partial [uncultured Solirubrobacteraceae bacterium]
EGAVDPERGERLRGRRRHRFRSGEQDGQAPAGRQHRGRGGVRAARVHDHGRVEGAPAGRPLLRRAPVHRGGDEGGRALAARAREPHDALARDPGAGEVLDHLRREGALAAEDVRPDGGEPRELLPDRGGQARPRSHEDGPEVRPGKHAARKRAGQVGLVDDDDPAPRAGREDAGQHGLPTARV